MIVTRHFVIHGHVQGVGYRYAMVIAAKNAGIQGWVRNCSDGTVEAIVQGTSEAIQTITAWAKTGPSPASVTELNDVEEKDSKTYIDFLQYPTL
ncbi:MAG: acylphosphatase [Pseudomonadota bacterium]